MTLRSPARALFGTVMLSTASISRLALQFFLIPILARILGPHTFGLMSIAMSFILLANVLSDAGLGAALVRDHSQDHQLRSTVFWLSLIVGTSLAVCVCIMAWPISIWFSQPQLAHVLCALSPILVLSSAISVSNAQIVRTQRFEIFAAGDLGCAIFSASAGIALAIGGFGIWSLVAQQLVLWTTKAAWVLAVTRFRPDFLMDIKLARPLMRFTMNNLAANMADFLGKSASILIVSRVVGVSAAGQYSMGYQLTRVADMVVSSPISVMTFSAIAGAPNRYAAANFVTTALRVLLIALAPLCVGLMLTADLAAPLLLGQKWVETAPVLAALAPGSLLVCLYGFANSAILGRGRSGRVFKLTLLNSLSISAGTFIGAHWGVTWGAVGFSIGASILVPLYIWSLAQIMRVQIRSLISATTTGVTATALMSVIVILVRLRITDFSPILQLVIAVAVGVVVFASAVLIIDGRQIRDDIMQLRRAGPEKVQPSSPAMFTQANEV